MTRPNSLPLLPIGVCNLVFFFSFSGCLVLGFLFILVSCFFVSFSLLVFWRAKDLDPTLCQFSHFKGCKFAFGWFYYLLWACGSVRKQCKKTMAKCRHHWRKLGGLGHKLGNFVCLCNMSERCWTNAKTRQNKVVNECVELILTLTFSAQTHMLKHFERFLEKEWCISLQWVLPSTSAFFL